MFIICLDFKQSNEYICFTINYVSFLYIYLLFLSLYYFFVFEDIFYSRALIFNFKGIDSDNKFDLVNILVVQEKKIHSTFQTNLEKQKN